MFSGLLNQLGTGSNGFTTGSGIFDAGTDFIGMILWVLGGNLNTWGS